MDKGGDTYSGEAVTPQVSIGTGRDQDDALGSAEKIRDGSAEVFYLDEIEELLGTVDWEYLKISSLDMFLHTIHKYRAILDLLFSLFFLEWPFYLLMSITFTAPQESMREPGLVLPRIIEAVENAPQDKGDTVLSKLDINDGYLRMVVE